MSEGIYNIVIGDNDELIKNVTSLYFEKGNKIIDVTYGKGVFWKKVNQDNFYFTFDDIRTTGVDFRALPYRDNLYDHGVLDPPYSRRNLEAMEECYATKKLTKHSEIVELYFKGLKELNRVVKPDGYILVKTQDEVCGCKQQWTHIEIYDFATQVLGMYGKDLIHLVNTRKPKINYKQQHSRKIVSYLWIFQVQ